MGGLFMSIVKRSRVYICEHRSTWHVFVSYCSVLFVTYSAGDGHLATEVLSTLVFV